LAVRRCFVVGSENAQMSWAGLRHLMG
jgi:hypothetical protein